MLLLISSLWHFLNGEVKKNRIKDETVISLPLLSHQCHISADNKRDPWQFSGASAGLSVLTDDNKGESKLGILSETGGSMASLIYLLHIIVPGLMQGDRKSLLYPGQNCCTVCVYQVLTLCFDVRYQRWSQTPHFCCTDSYNDEKDREVASGFLIAAAYFYESQLPCVTSVWCPLFCFVIPVCLKLPLSSPTSVILCIALIVFNYACLKHLFHITFTAQVSLVSVSSSFKITSAKKISCYFF